MLNNVISILITFFLFFLTIFVGNIFSDLVKPHLNKSKSFIVYYGTNKTDKSKIRLYFNRTAFQSVLAENYTQEELEKEFVMERVNVKLAKEMYNISLNTIEIETAHGKNTTVKAIMVKDKDGNHYMPFFRTKKDYDAFFKEIF